MTTDISPIIREKAPLILTEINKAESILLHCHPSPDPDSVGSALAMKFVLEQLGKKVNVIKGDSDIPEAFMHFPGAHDIVKKNFFEIDLKDFDLFIIQDSGSKEMISRLKPIEFPLPIKTIVIDHHISNQSYGDINLVDSSYPATAQLLFDLFKEMNITITPDSAANLFIGMYTDTGGFKYEGTTSATFAVAAELVRIYPNFSKIISDMENSNTLGDLAFSGIALSSLEKICGDKVLLSVVPYSLLQEKNIPAVSISAGSISSILRTVGDFHIVGALIESKPNNTKVSFRTRDANTYDVSKLAVALGGGGHKAAAGASLDMSLDEVKKMVVSKIKELYNL